MEMAFYTVAVGYGRVPDDPALGDGVTDAVEITVNAGTAAAAICVAVMDYQSRYAAAYPKDEVVTASVIAVSTRRAAAGTPRRRRAPRATTATTTSGGRGRGGTGRRRA